MFLKSKKLPSYILSEEELEQRRLDDQKNFALHMNLIKTIILYVLVAFGFLTAGVVIFHLLFP